MLEIQNKKKSGALIEFWSWGINMISKMDILAGDFKWLPLWHLLHTEIKNTNLDIRIEEVI